jgi:hypothetical protein
MDNKDVQLACDVVAQVLESHPEVSRLSRSQYRQLFRDLVVEASDAVQEGDTDLQEVPSEWQAELRAWLEDDRDLETFFNVAGLGDPAGYNLAEFGRGRERRAKPQPRTLKALPAEWRTVLAEWVKEGHALREFFEMGQTDLGDPAEYDLSAFADTDGAWIAELAEGRV